MLLGLAHSELEAHVRQLPTDAYEMDVESRKVRTGALDENDKPVMFEKVTVVRLEMDKAHIPRFLEPISDQVDHELLREMRFRAYRGERLTEDLDAKHYGSSDCQVRLAATVCKGFLLKLGKIPEAKRRKKIVRALTKFLDQEIYTNTVQSTDSTPNESDPARLMYNVYVAVRALVNSDCYVTKHLATLIFSEDRSVPFRLDPTTFVLHYPSKSLGRSTMIDIPATLRCELRQLQRIRSKQNTSAVFVNPKSRVGKQMSYSALTKFASRFSR